jgi:glucose dehydrogenase
MKAILSLALIALLATGAMLAKDWPAQNYDLAGTRYSPLKQINTSNVARLRQVWTFKLRSDGQAPFQASEAVPIVVNGVMYLPAANRVVALEPETGKEIWRYVSTGSLPSRRGVAYWPGGNGHAPRIIVTLGRRLLALNARTGSVETSFGKNGEVDMVVPYNSPVTVGAKARRTRSRKLGRRELERPLRCQYLGTFHDG